MHSSFFPRATRNVRHTLSCHMIRLPLFTEYPHMWGTKCNINLQFVTSSCNTQLLTVICTIRHQHQSLTSLFITKLFSNFLVFLSTFFVASTCFIYVTNMADTAIPDRIHMTGASTNIRRTITPYKHEIQCDQFAGSFVGLHFELLTITTILSIQCDFHIR